MVMCSHSDGEHCVTLILQMGYYILVLVVGV